MLELLVGMQTSTDTMEKCGDSLKNWKLNCLQFSSFQSLSRVRLFATPWTTALQALHGILQERILEWGAISFSYMYTHTKTKVVIENYDVKRNLLSPKCCRGKKKSSFSRC